ncbi:ComF family protein [Bartonella sp. F02]|uniref:ComF family protein n=1 Tax=Bartonella sp. F02 TaxID=2967262 RepID=UPI0022A9CB23|nr:ComF family protein [Bartonella sp. F02]MCZ2328438.1 ComF family protein [Bartonella sp. F02]
MLVVNSKSILSKYIEFFTAILYPPTCPGCKTRVSSWGTMCANCWNNLQFITKPYCPILGTPFAYDMGDGFLSGEAIQGSYLVSRVRSAVVHKGLARSLIVRLKYGDRIELARFMADWMMFAGRDMIDDCDIIIPIPLHSRRFFWRRYNQSAELARYIAKKQDKPFKPGWLFRCRYTRPQVGLSATERKKNLHNAFQIPDKFKQSIKDCSVLLVDDVLTTGVTVSAAATILKQAGARQVDVLTFSRVLKDNTVFNS